VLRGEQVVLNRVIANGRREKAVTTNEDRQDGPRRELETLESRVEKVDTELKAVKEMNEALLEIRATGR